MLQLEQNSLTLEGTGTTLDDEADDDDDEVDTAVAAPVSFL